MKALIALTLAALVSITGCASFDKLVSVADTTLSVPTAREELQSYLNDDELLAVADEIKLLDRTYQPIADAVFGQADISLEDALERALGTAVKSAQLEQAYKVIRQTVRDHRDNSKDENGVVTDPIPANLARVSTEVEVLWDDWASVVVKNRRAMLYINLAAKLALPL